MEEEETLKLPGNAHTPTGHRRTPEGGVCWLPPTPEQLAKLLPQYDVERLVGQGGMGAVYKGVQRSLERPVAIKLLPREVGGMEDSYIQRFRNEAKIMARLDHPSIVPVYDFGETSDGQLYFVMAFIEGSDVHQLVQAHGRLPQEQALRIAMHLCDALHYAHTNGIIHRDIKPSNVLIGANGHVKVADFGLAKANDAPGSGPLTQTGMAMGTPDFVAPETLLMGSQVDGRADLYAVGVMLYQMLCGRIPRGAFDVPSRICGCDPRFDDIAMKAMQYDREERYQTAFEIHCALDAIYSAPLPVAVGQPKVKIATKSISEQLAEMVKNLPSASYQPGGESSTTTPRQVQPQAAAKTRTALYAGIALLACAIIGSAIHFGRVKPTPPPEPVTTDALEPGAIKLYDSPEKLPKGGDCRWDKNALVLGGIQNQATKGLNGIIRASIRMDKDAKSPQISLRHSVTKSPTAGQELFNCYALVANSLDRKIALWVSVSGKLRLLKEWPLPRAYGADEWARLELRAVGDELTASLDGRVLGTIHDNSVSDPGVVALFANANGYFRDIVYIPLDPPGTATLATVAAEPWMDLLKHPEKLMLFDGKLDKNGLTTSAGNGCYIHGIGQSGHADGAIRIRMHHDPAARPVISVRRHKDAVYLFHVNEESTRLHLSLSSSSQALKTFDLPKPLVAGEEYTLELRVVGTRLTGRFNGNEVVQVEDATLPDGEFSINADPFGKSVTVTGFEFLDLSTATPAPPLGYPQPREWKDRTEKIRNEGLKLGELVTDGEWLTLAPGKEWHPSIPLSGKSVGDVAIRVFFSGNISVPLRQSDDGSYIASVGSDTKIVLYRKGLPNTDLKSGIDLGADYVAAAEHEMVFAAQGDQLTLWVDGKVVASVRDGTSRTGGMQIAFYPNTRIKKVETGELETVATSPPGSIADLLTSPDYEWSKPENLGPNVNSEGEEFQLALTDDGLILVFTSLRKGGPLFEARRKSVSESFGVAVPIQELNAVGHDHGSPFISADGLTLLYHAMEGPNDRGQRDIYETHRRDLNSPWEPPVNLGPSVNTVAFDVDPSLSQDGLTLLYSSNHEGSLGSMDLWRAHRTSIHAPFLASENLGPRINTQAGEASPVFIADPQTILFTREGTKVASALNLAVEDAKGQWTTRTLDLPGVSDAGGVYSPTLSPDGHTLYFGSNYQTPGGRGANDLWQMRRVPKAKPATPK